MEEHNKISKEETELITRVFKGNDTLLKAIRAIFFNLSPTEEQKQLVKSTFTHSPLMKVIRRRFCPELDKDSEIGTVQDVWLGVEQMVFSQPVSTIEQAVKYKDQAITMTKKALALLENPDGEKVNITFDPKLNFSDPLRIDLLARNQFIRHVEQQLVFLKVIANQNSGIKDVEKPKRK